MNLPDWAAIFTLGCIGALAPEVVRLYKLRNHPDAYSWSWFYVVISIAFGALGGTIAVILPATTHLAAFYAGVSTPLIINTILRNAGAGQMEPAEIKQTREDIKRRAEMSPEERRGQQIKDLFEASGRRGIEDPKEASGSSIGDSFLARQRRLRLHDYLNSL